MKRRLRRWLFPPATVFLAAAVTFGLLEFIAWSAFHKDWPRKPAVLSVEGVISTGRGSRLKPNLNFTQWSEAAGRMVNFRSNSLGFRGREISIKKPAGATRILVLGDSITIQTGFPEEETYPYLLEKILSDSRKVEVINAGVPGVGLQEEIYILKETGLRVSPDLVLIGFYLNDSRPPWGFENEYYKLPPWLAQASKTIEQYSYLYKWIWKRFLARKFTRRNLAAIWNWTGDYNKGDWRTDQDAYLRVIKGARLDFGAAWQDTSWPDIYAGLD